VSLASSALRRPITTISATLGIVLLGAVSLSRLPVALLPDVTLPVLTIRTVYPGAAATEVSRLIAEPIEEAVASTPGLSEVRSVARIGEATTTLRFAWGTDMAHTVLLVRERLDNARAQLPERAERPTLLTSDPGERPIAVLALSGPGDLLNIARTAEDVHARRLEQLQGIASVAVAGRPEEEIRIEVDPERTRALNITPDQIANAVRQANASAPGGTVRRGQFRLPLRAFTEFGSIDEILETPVGPSRSGIRLQDLATVRLTTADPVTLTRLDGKAAVGLVVYKDAGSNTVTVTRALYEVVGELVQEFPNIQVAVVAAQAEFVTDALSNLGQEILAGGLMSLIVILLFIRDVRTSLAIGLIVPLSVLMALVVLQQLNVTINILSLGGLALGVGLLVDNAIVVAEATGRLREEGRPLLEAARVAAEQVSAPLIAGTLTTLLVFGPIVFVQGLGAALFRDLSLSVVTTVGASLILALTLMPVMMTTGRARRAEARPPRPVAATSRLYAFGHRAAESYERGMMWCLDRPVRVFAAAILVTAVTVVITLRLPREILPGVEEGIVVVSLKLADGTAIEETTRQAGRLEDAARAKGASGIYSRIGTATDEEVLAGADPGSSSSGQVLIPVPEGVTAEQFANDLRLAVPDLAQGYLAFDLAGQSEFGSLIGREGRTIRVEVSGPRAEEAAQWADSVRAHLAQIPSLTDVRHAFSGTQPSVEMTFERTRIAQRGLTLDAVSGAIAGGLGGVEANDFRETDRRTPIRVRFVGEANEDLEAALSTPVGGIPAGQLVRTLETPAAIEVVRVNQRPVAVIDALVESGGTARASRDVEEALSSLAPPPGLSWSLSGADVEQRKTTAELGLVGILAVALVFLVLAGEFASFTTPLLIMLTVPLAAAGGIVLLWLTGQSLNTVSLIGLVVMIGIADNDAVVKLDAIRRFRQAGHSVNESVLLGGRQRLRAITMTSITTIVGVLPLVFGWGSGGELYQPLAAGIIGGSVSATLVTFFLLPTAYAVVERRGERRTARASGLEPAA
jgi:HAE1 family hydrophobic/amphiphilic exporter-1